MLVPVGNAGKLTIPTFPIVLLPTGKVGSDATFTAPIVLDPVGNAGIELTLTLPMALLPGDSEGIEVTATDVDSPPPPPDPPRPSTISVVSQIDTDEATPLVTISLANPAPYDCPEAAPFIPSDKAGVDPTVCQGPVAVGAICNDIRNEEPVVTKTKAINIDIPSGIIRTLVVEVPATDTPD